MKEKITIMIDKEVMRLAKETAAKEHRTLSQLIEEALVTCFRQETTTPYERKKAYELFCERPMKLTRKQLRLILNEDIWAES
jgi:hypothetical protein